MSEQNQENQENPWPGFVDIMSSALLVFVFLVLVQLLVIAGVSMKISESAAQRIIEETINKSPQATQSVEKSENTNEAETRNPLEIVREDAARVLPELDALRIVYSQLETILSEKNLQVIDQWINQNKANMENRKVQLTSFLSIKDLSLSTSAFVSYNRLMDIRSRLIKHGIPAKNITVRIDNTSTERNNHVLIQVSQ